MTVGSGDSPQNERSGSDALLRAHGGAGIFAQQNMREQGAEGSGDSPQYKRGELFNQLTSFVVELILQDTVLGNFHQFESALVLLFPLAYE